MSGTTKSVCFRLYSRNVAFRGSGGGIHGLHRGVVTQPPPVVENDMHHKVTLLPRRSNVQHHGMQGPLPPQAIEKLMVRNQLVLLLVVDM